MKEPTSAVFEFIGLTETQELDTFSIPADTRNVPGTELGSKDLGKRGSAKQVPISEPVDLVGQVLDTAIGVFDFIILS